MNLTELLLCQTFGLRQFSWEGVSLELAQGLPRVALAWHKAGRSTPFGVTLACVRVG